MNAKSNIFCPNCSAGNKIEQNFCRFCGLNLRDTAKSLTAQLSSKPKEQRFKRLELMKKLSDYSAVVFVLAAAAGMLIFAYSDWSNSFFFGRKSFISTLIIGYLVFQSMLTYYRRKNTIGYADKMAMKNAPLFGEIKTAETKKLLEEKPFTPVASVTENSTELLFVENKTRKLG